MAKHSAQKDKNHPLHENNIGIITTFLENQKQELANQAQDIELRKLNEKNAHDYACRALNAQKEDRKEQREQGSKVFKYLFWLFILILLLFSSFVGAALYLDKTAMLTEVFKAIIYILPSFFGAYFFGYNRGKKKAIANNDNYAEVIED